jgi:hypothetical protein
MKKIPRFVIRTIKDGRVKVFGRTYRADTTYMFYDGRLENIRYVFGIYKKYVEGKVEPDNIIVLWGSEKAYRGLEEPNAGPDVVNGVMPWALWYVE